MSSLLKNSTAIITQIGLYPSSIVGNLCIHSGYIWLNKDKNVCYFMIGHAINDCNLKTALVHKQTLRIRILRLCDKVSVM